MRTIATALIAVAVPAAAFADEPVGRYQMVTVQPGAVMIVDTATGDLWRAWLPSVIPGPAANPGGIAYVGKIGHETAPAKPASPPAGR